MSLSRAVLSSVKDVKQDRASFWTSRGAASEDITTNKNRIIEGDFDIASRICSCASDRDVRRVVIESVRFHNRSCWPFGSFKSGVSFDSTVSIIYSNG